MVIRDYSEYNSIIKKLEKDIKDLSEDNSKLKKEIRYLNEQLSLQTSSENSNRTATNIDLLKRISHLEKVVFNFPNVKNYDEFLSALKKDRSFEHLIQSMTIDQIAGKSSLGKGKSIK